MNSTARLSKADRKFHIINNSFLAIAFALVSLPIVYIISSSFSSPDAVISGKVWLWPVDFSLEGYKAVFENSQILTGYANTIFYTVTGTIINIFMTIFAAYPLSRKDFNGRNLFMFLFTFTMIFNGGIIPNYLLMRDLGILNTRWVMIIPGAIGVYNVIITRTYYQTQISTEILDAARIDGCSDFRFMFHIVIPLSKAITAVIALFYAVQHWNAFFQAFIYLSKQELFPLQIILRDILVLNSIDASLIDDPELMAAKQGLADLLKYSLIIVASLPVWCVYTFVQKFFVKGVMIGAIKG